MRQIGNKCIIGIDCSFRRNHDVSILDSTVRYSILLSPSATKIAYFSGSSLAYFANFVSIWKWRACSLRINIHNVLLIRTRLIRMKAGNVSFSLRSSKKIPSEHMYLFQFQGMRWFSTDFFMRKAQNTSVNALRSCAVCVCDHVHKPSWVQPPTKSSPSHEAKF